MKFRDIPSFTRGASYRCNVSWDYLEDKLKSWMDEKRCPCILSPDYQRGHVWTQKQQIAYVEFILRDGHSSRDLFWNCPGWMSTFKGPLELVDGKQRLNAALRFLRNEIRAFGHFYREYEDRLPSTCDFVFHVNNLPDRKQILQWYLDLNEGGTPHSKKELQRVHGLLAAEELTT